MIGRQVELDNESKLLVSMLSPHEGIGQQNLLFDVEVYADCYFQLTGERPFSASEALWHWLEVGRSKRIVPTLLFDEDYYLQTQPDVKEASYFGFVHFLLHGMAEGRAPTCWFNLTQYAGHLNSGELPSYRHFLHVGIKRGIFPCEEARRMILAIDPEEKFSLHIYQALLRSTRRLRPQPPVAAFELLAILFVPQWHRPAASAIQSFINYLDRDLVNAVSPGPLFDPDVYRERALALGQPIEGLESNPVLHWLLYGAPARIVPTGRFDEAFYLRSNSEIAASVVWSFIHFVRHGVFEGRAGTKERRFRQATIPVKRGITHLAGQHQRWFAQDFPTQQIEVEGQLPERLQRRLASLLDSDAFHSILADAQELDPSVGEIDDITDCLLLPYYDDMAPLHTLCRTRIPRLRYDTVICVPWIRLGGADLVAGLLASALLRIRPGETVLILRTDHPHFERADWLPSEADVVDVSDLMASITLPRAQHLLKVILNGIEAKRVFNVNSRLCWTVFRDHGAYMAKTFHTYAYLFCWDHRPSGLREGYPAEFFAETIDHLTGCLTDTVYLRDQLSQMYNLPLEVRDRITPLFSPAQSALRPLAVAREVASIDGPVTRSRVLWGGRLDRQKRFDLVIELARRMPDVEFWCWGLALLDRGPDLSKLPPNIVMKGTFAKFDDLPLTSAGLWLFTALWEGMPTTLIELATRGVGIVASAVGGVPELVTPVTGWPISADASVGDYEHAIREALQDPEEVARRAEALQRKVGAIYNSERYDQSLAEILAGEVL